MAAINCDDENNKAFCGSMGVKGFPTLKTVRPTLKTGKPIVQDYQGPRTAKDIVEAVKGIIPNHVKRVSDKELDGWLKEGNDTTKAILFSNKGTTSALIKVLAGEYYGKLAFAQIRDKDTKAISTFGVSAYPTLMVLPGGTEPAVVYDGPMVKASMQAFLGQYAYKASDGSTIKEQNQKPLAEPEKKPSTDSAQSSSDSSTFSKASASYASEEASSAAASASTITIDLPTPPTESPDPIATPADAPAPAVMPDMAPPLSQLNTPEDLQAQCVGPKTPTCILVLLPSSADADAMLPESATQALTSLSEIAEKHKQRGTKLFPFFSIPATNVAATSLREGLGLKSSDEVELLAVNGRRGWWKGFTGKGHGIMDVEGWVDGIRLGEGKKAKIPEGLLNEEKAAGEKEKIAEEKPSVKHEEL